MLVVLILWMHYFFDQKLVKIAKTKNVKHTCVLAIISLQMADVPITCNSSLDFFASRYAPLLEIPLNQYGSSQFLLNFLELNVFVPAITL